MENTTSFTTTLGSTSTMPEITLDAWSPSYKRKWLPLKGMLGQALWHRVEAFFARTCSAKHQNLGSLSLSMCKTLNCTSRLQHARTASLVASFLG